MKGDVFMVRKKQCIRAPDGGSGINEDFPDKSSAWIATGVRGGCADLARRDNTSSKSKFCSPPQLAIHQFRLNLEKRTDY